MVQAASSGANVVPDQFAPVSEAELRSILKAAFGNVEVVASVSPLAGGSINTTFRLELCDRAPVILRIAPSDARAAAGPSWLTPWGLRREGAVIALATPALGALLPKTIASDFDRTVVDRDWVVQEQMPGVPLSTVDADLPPDERATLWTELGQLTARLHATPGAWFGPPVAGPRFDRLSDLLRHDAAGLLDDAARFDLPDEPFRRLQVRIDEVADLFDDNPGPRLIHSDLARSHVFVDRNGDAPFRVFGIIDLEFGRFADPRFERLITSFLWGRAPAEMREPFFAGYGRRFDTPEDRRRLRVFVALAIAWAATLIAAQERRNVVPGVIARMEDALLG